MVCALALPQPLGQSLQSTGCAGAACTARPRESPDTSHGPQREGDAVGWGKEEWKDRAVFPLCSCPALLQFLSVFVSFCRWVCAFRCVGQISFPRETTQQKPSLSQLFKAELSGHLYLVIPAPKPSFAAALRIPVRAEVEAEHFWTPENRSCLHLSTQGPPATSQTLPPFTHNG